MPAVDIQVDEIQAWLPNLTVEQANMLIKGTVARAARHAPCILDASFTYADAAADIIRSAIKRRAEAEPGMSYTRQRGGIQEQIDAKGLPKVIFWDSEILELQQLCEAYNGATIEGIGPVYSMPDSPLLDHRYRSALGIEPQCP